MVCKGGKMKLKIMVTGLLIPLIIFAGCSASAQTPISPPPHLSINYTDIMDCMLVFYTTEDGRVTSWYDSDSHIIDKGDNWDVICPPAWNRGAQGINKALVTYGYYEYTPVERGQVVYNLTPMEKPPTIEEEIIALKSRITFLEDRLEQLGALGE
jgi:hypothetical protein